MNLLKAWFLGRLLREKVLVFAFVLLGALIWVSSASTHLTDSLRAFRAAESSLAEQAIWLNNRAAIEQAAKDAAAHLDPARTYDATYLVAEITSMAEKAEFRLATEPPRTQRSPQFAIHTAQVNISRVELPKLLRFYQEIVSKAPYIGLESVRLQGDRSMPGTVNVNMQIASVELLSEAGVE